MLKSFYNKHMYEHGKSKLKKTPSITFINLFSYFNMIVLAELIPAEKAIISIYA